MVNMGIGEILHHQAAVPLPQHHQLPHLQVRLHLTPHLIVLGTSGTIKENPAQVREFHQAVIVPNLRKPSHHHLRKFMLLSCLI